MKEKDIDNFLKSKYLKELTLFINNINKNNKNIFKLYKKITCSRSKTIIIHTEDSKKGCDIFNNVLDINDCEYINVE